MIHRHLLSKISIIAFTAIFMLSCDSGSKKSSEETTGEEAADQSEATTDFKISLAQWSLHKTFFGGNIEDWGWFGRMIQESPDSILRGDLDPIDFPEIAAGYGIKTIELVNTFYFSKANDKEYWVKFKDKCDKADVSVWLIMCDALGNLGDADPELRKITVENHYKWVDIANFLGATAIRVNAGGQGSPEVVARNAADGISMLADYAKSKGVDVIVENHGGYSSDGKWLSGLMEDIGMDNVGTLPDFGNFCIERGPEGCLDEYDRYQGMADLMPYAKGVSAKSNAFDENGNEVNSDFLRIMKIVKESGFKGYVGVEYEGSQLSEDEGIKATKALLEKVFKQL